MGDVGTSKVFENERIIVWEFVLEPGSAICSLTGGMAVHELNTCVTP